MASLGADPDSKPVLTKSLGKLFLPVIKSRGEAYASQNRVHIKELEEGRVVAVVRGTRQYRVTLSWSEQDPTRIKTSCTCPFFRQGIPCKHLWATIVVADRSRWMPSATEERITDPGDLFSDRFWPRSLPGMVRNGNGFQPQTFILWYSLRRDSMGHFISVQERYVKKSGAFGRTRPLQNSSMDRDKLAADDRLLIPLVEDALSRNHVYGRPGMTRRLEYVPLTPRELEVMLPILARTGRCSVEDAVSGITVDRLDTEVATACFRLKASKDEGKAEAARLQPVLRLPDGLEISPGLPRLWFDTDPPFFVLEDRLHRVDGPRLSALRALAAAGDGGMRVEMKRLPELMERQEASGRRIIELTDSVVPERVKGLEPRLKFLVELDRQGGVTGSLFFLYDDVEIPVDGGEGKEGNLEFLDLKSWRRIRRDPAAEAALLAEARKAGLDTDMTAASIRADEVHEVLDRLDRMGVILETPERKPFVTGRVGRFKISSGIDWFDVEASVEFDGESVSLPAMLEAYLQGKRTIRLNSGRTGLLPSSWLKRHLAPLRLASSQGDQGRAMRFHASQALLIESLLEDMEEELRESCSLEADQAYEERVAMLRSFDGITPLEAPEGFSGHLRPYQKEALGWFRFLERMRLGGILADDMGLGKTVQVLAWLCGRPGRRKDAPNLVVAPTSLLFNWMNEAARFAPTLKVLNHAGSNRQADPEHFARFDLVVTSYGIMRRDIEALSKIPFNYVILDESQAIKNPDAVSSKAATVLDAAHRLCLTGTPLENHAGELWSQMQFLNPGLLGPREQFFNSYVKPINAGDREALETLQKMVRPFILRRTKEEVAKELPPKVEKLIMCPMTDEQKELYHRLKSHYRQAIAEAVEAKGLNRSRFKMLEGLLRLRQVANHPGLLDVDAPSGKFSRLMALIREAVASGHKALVFSQFTKMLQLIRQALEEEGLRYEYLDGRTPRRERETRVGRFQQEKDLRLFLISLRAGGFGLNLTAADYVFIVDPWWNPAVELQAIDRSHRIGQSKTVVTYRLISEGTVEEKVMHLQEKKRRIAGSVLSGSKDMISRLSARDLEILLS